MKKDIEIKEIIKRGEGQKVDFKRSLPSKIRELTQEICAFANAQGGLLLIGVNDEGQIVGCTIDNRQRSALQTAIREISPCLSCEQYSIEIDDNEILVIEVPEGRDKPYFLSGAIYIREGANCQKLVVADDIHDIYMRSNKAFFDEAPMPRVDLLKIADTKMIEEFRREAGISNNIAAFQILDNMQVFDDDGLTKRGGILFFASHPEDIFFHAVIHCVLFKGTDKVIILDDKTFGGPLVWQYRQAMTWLQNTLRVAYEIEGAGPRREVWEIPLTAFKEAIINALAHRDYYEKGASITIEVFDDRVEISNPGELLPLVARNFGRRSLSRNPLLFGLFSRMRLVEHVGSGIPRMRRAMEEADLPEPRFENDGMFCVTFARRIRYSDIVGGPMLVREDGDEKRISPQLQHSPTLKPVQKQILGIMARDPHVTLPVIAQQVGLSRTMITRHVKQLQEQGLLARKGRKSDGEWVVKRDVE